MLYLNRSRFDQRNQRLGAPARHHCKRHGNGWPEGLTIAGTSASIAFAGPVGPSQRSYAMPSRNHRQRHIASRLPCWRWLKRIESEFGRRPRQAWSQRVLDLDIIL